MNLLAIADGLATRFVGATASGESIAVGPTARLPNAIAKGPALLVYPPFGALELQTTARRNDLYTFPIRLLRDPLDVPQRTAMLYAWYDAIHDLVTADINLGLSYVSYAEPVATRLGIDLVEYAGKKFDLVELSVRVRVNEHVTTVSP